jgi:hypothetical protein
VPRGGRETGEREAPGMAVSSAGRRTRLAMALGRRARAAALFHELGRAAGRGRHGAARLTCEAEWRRGPMAAAGVREREKSGAAQRWGADRRARATQCRGVF